MKKKLSLLSSPGSGARDGVDQPAGGETVEVPDSTCPVVSAGIAPHALSEVKQLVSECHLEAHATPNLASLRFSATIVVMATTDTQSEAAAATSRQELSLDDLLVIMTATTCGFACWQAREDVCRCSCGGVNHGIHRRGGTATRTCKAGRARYELVAVVAAKDKPYRMAAELVKELGGKRQHSYTMRPNWGPPPLVAIQPATKAQQKWPEVADAFAGWNERKPGEILRDVWDRRPNLIWKRIA